MDLRLVGGRSSLLPDNEDDINDVGTGDIPQQQQEQAVNWQEHLKDYDWKSNLKALKLELESPHNFRWEITLQVTVVWPAMRKWALQTLQKCLTGRARHLNKAQQKEFLSLFQKCPFDKLTQLTFIEPISIVENLETLEKQAQGDEEEWDDNVQSALVNENDKGEAASTFSSQIWSIEAGNVDPLLDAALAPMQDTSSLGEPIEQTFADWEPDELKALDWQANMDALKIELSNSHNTDWETTEIVSVRDWAVQRWAEQTLVLCLGFSHKVTNAQRNEFLALFDNRPKSSLRRLKFKLQEQQQQVDNVIEQGFGKIKLAEDDKEESALRRLLLGTGQDIIEEDSSDDSSVYLD